MTSGSPSGGTAGTDYGPYLRNNFPNNPIDSVGTVTVVATMPAAATAAGGWIYDSTTGEFRANVSGTGPSGVDYFEL